ncbi:WD40 repeat [Dillenia turbinata]|uniref:WD40 repeat n=1 Tax=Dillenia turbinata TaxID=194707 RepID=A0AAN8VN35_9MAGN
MDSIAFHDANISDMIESRTLDFRHDVNHRLQMHSSLLRRLSQEKELEGHQGCVNSIAWNSKGSLLVSGSDDTQINIWSYSGRKLLHSIDTGHSANIFCTKFVPETSDELLVSGAGDAEVEVGNPHVVWSASEDGTLRQHDFREGSSCPPAGSTHQECRNILLDLRSGAKRSLADAPLQRLLLKSCDISSMRPNLLLVGGSDAFARLYDRRMLPPLTSCSKKMSPPPCLAYFCPMHLSERGRSSVHLTHVAFSPNGEEILLSYSGEHVYLMNVDNAGGSAMQYTSGDFAKLMSSTHVPCGVELQPPVSETLTDSSPFKSSAAARLDKCRKLIQYADKSLNEGKDYYNGIEACNEVLDGHGHEIGSLLRHECLWIRAALLLKRQWKNDAYMAIRDCNEARKIDSSSFKALYYMSEALLQLGKHKEALDFALAAQCLVPYNPEVGERVENIKQHLAAAEVEKLNKTNNGGPKPESRSGSVLSLSDILYQSDVNSDVSPEGPKSDREDSDYDEELEVHFETSVSGDEGHDVESSSLPGSLNLRFHRRGDSARETGANGSCGSPRSSFKNDRIYQPETVIDMKQRYVGHCNVGTDIKQASFLGQRGEYIASGSDDGRWFIWEKRSGRLIKMLLGDEAVVNCIQSHPFDCAIATSGIDNTIKLWTPTASVPSIVAGGAAGPETSNVLDAMESNQQRFSRLLNFWSNFTCMSLQKGRCIHLNVILLSHKELFLLFQFVLLKKIMLTGWCHVYAS